MIALLLLLSGCFTGRQFLIDYYEISWGDFYTQGRKGYCIGCQIRGESDKIIENIKSVKWNNKIIVVEQDNTDNENWFVIIAKGEALKCGNNDQTYGPLIKSQVDSILKANNTSNLNEKTLIK